MSITAHFVRVPWYQAAEARARTGALLPNGPHRLGGTQRGITPQQVHGFGKTGHNLLQWVCSHLVLSTDRKAFAALFVLLFCDKNRRFPTLQRSSYLHLAHICRQQPMLQKEELRMTLVAHMVSGLAQTSAMRRLLYWSIFSKV